MLGFTSPLMPFWAKIFSKIGPLLEVGTFCGKSSIYLGLAAKEENQWFLDLVEEIRHRALHR